MQLFAQSPRTWRFPEHAEEDLARFRERRAEAGIGSVLVHALYLCNLATPDDVIYGKSVATMRATVDTACAIEADGVVFHVGSHLGAGFDAGLERCVPALREVLEHCSDTTWLLLENSAGAGGTIGRSIDELAAIVDALDGHERLGVCLDSCHLYVSGVDVGEPKQVTATMKEVRRRGSGSTGSARSTSTTPRRRSARTATGTRTCSKASSASGSAPSSRTGRCRGCRR